MIDSMHSDIVVFNQVKFIDVVDSQLIILMLYFPNCIVVWKVVRLHLLSHKPSMCHPGNFAWHSAMTIFRKFEM